MKFNNHIALSNSGGARNSVVAYDLSLINGNRHFRRSFLKKFRSVFVYSFRLGRALGVP